MRIILALSILISAGTARAEISSSEEKLLAAFIFNLTKFAHWTAAAKDGPIRIHVVSNADIAGALSAATEGKSIGSRKLEVKSVGLEKPEATEVVVLIPSKEDPAKLLPKFKGCHCLVVTKKEGMAVAGATINFFIRDDRLRFEVNLKAAKAEGIELDSQLLRLGEIVQQ